MACPAINATVRLASLFQQVKNRLEPVIQKGVTFLKSCAVSYLKDPNTNECRNTKSSCKLSSNWNRCIRQHCTHLSRQRPGVKRRPRIEVADLLGEVYFYVPLGDLPFRMTVKADTPYVRQDLRFNENSQNIHEFDDVLNLSTVLLNRLQSLSGSHALSPGISLVDDSLYGEALCDKCVANLQHILGYLQQSALDAIVHHYLRLVETQMLRWQRYRQYLKRIGEEWFAEWPNSQRPLSTTWPWNIKPSLLVLWGVCWMFYGDDEKPTGYPRRGAPVSEELGRGLTSIQSQQQNTPNYSWLHPQQARVHPRRANSETTPVNTLSTYVPSYSYLSSPSNPSSQLYPSSTVTWPYCQGINPGPGPAYAPDYNPWQPALDPSAHAPVKPQYTLRSNTPQPYAQRVQTANPRLAPGGVGGLGFGLGWQQRDMQDYPSPSGSSTSVQTTSSYVSALPASVQSPSIPLMASPSLAGSSGSRQSSSRKSQEPPRNADGMLYCNHPEHALQPQPVFSRKCEWTKHMDKHNRPYVCEEPGCENIRGFTYSGGLRRHQREVHRQHGGPKASCMCPYRDCKRHVGVGFSRKENLHEHLRRVHRDLGADAPGGTVPSSEGAQIPTSGTPSQSRKRKRVAPRDDGDDNNDDEDAKEEDLEQEVKKLRGELQEKDERLDRLEKMVKHLAGGREL